jgi:hypothetical protein
MQGGTLTPITWGFVGCFVDRGEGRDIHGQFQAAQPEMSITQAAALGLCFVGDSSAHFPTEKSTTDMGNQGNL